MSRKQVSAEGPALSAKVGDEAVKRATGRDWAGWVRRLDNAGAAGMTHTQIAAHLHGVEGVGDWWAQMVTVGYEQVKGRRAKHEKADGFSVSASKTIAASVEAVFHAFTRGRDRGRWLRGAEVTIRKATEFKSVRITWHGGSGVKGEEGTSVEVNMYEKEGKDGVPRAMVQVQHSKIAEERSAAALKAWWKERLGILAGVLEG